MLAKARAMVVCNGIERANQYFAAFREYLDERKSPYRAIVAFSGEHDFGGVKVTESSLNGLATIRQWAYSRSLNSSERQEWMAGMLCDKELIDLVDAGVISGLALPPDRFSYDSPVQPSSVDLHIGGIYLPRATADEAGGEHQPLSEHLLTTGETVLIRTAEVLKLPNGVGGFAFPPSRFAVKALLVTNAGHVDPEYSGSLRFTVINMGHEPQKLEVGARVGTLVLFRTAVLPQRGWTTRSGSPGRNPNTEDLRYLARDFAEVGQRASEIAQSLIHRWEFRLAAWLTFLTLIIAFVGVYSPYVKLENKISTIHEEVTHTKETEETFAMLKQEIQQLQQTNSNDKQQLDALDRRLKMVESRTPHK